MIKIHLAAWPSIQEIRDSSLEDAYFGGLKEFYDSIEELKVKATNAQVPFEMYMDMGVYHGRRAFGMVPPTIPEIIFFLSSSGIAVGLYKLLRLWVDSKNGRKIRVKTGDFEIETTQISEKKFLKLYDILYAKQKSDSEASPPKEMDKVAKKKLKQILLSEDFTLLDPDSKEQDHERFAVYLEAMKSIDKARNKEIKD